MAEEKKLGIYTASFTRAAEALKACDLPHACAVCGASLQENRVVVTFFNQRVAVILHGMDFDPPDIPVYEQILLLHYLTTLGTSPSTGSLVGFKNLPGASFYESAYRRRGTERILQLFGADFDGFRSAVMKLGGTVTEKGGEGFGDISGTLSILPRIEATVVLFGGDEEFPPEANILYSDDIVNFLPLEDIAVLSGLVAGRLKRALAASRP